METIADRLKQIRKHFNLTQDEFSKEVKVGASTLAMWETGARSIKDIHIAAICSTFNIEEEWLRNGKGSMIEELDQEERIVAWAAKIASSEQKNIAFIKQLLSTFSTLTPHEWLLLEKICNSIKSSDSKKD